MPNDPRRQRLLRTTPLSVSFSLEEREKVVEASLSFPSVSAFIREAAVQRAERELAKAAKKAA